MAASQVECLEEDNVNLKLSESFPQFVYCEKQRQALEALMAGDAGAFRERVRLEKIRPFLSEEEVNWVRARAEDDRHGEETEEEGDPELGEDLSLTYWPAKSDVQAPYLVLGWPETSMWKGITRATVYTHPPMVEQPTIKEMVRRLLQNAKQVIAVVMDTFTDADIFLDLVEAAGGRRVPAYVLLSQRHLPQFIGMAEKVGANLRLMDNIRVRALVGCSFCSRDGKKVTGDVKERFLLVDGETVVTGSYSFTWTDARLQRNLVTLLTGQVVDAFDREFRTLYAASKPLRNSDFAPPPAEGAKWGAALPNGLSSPLRFVTTGALQPVALLASCFGGPLERPLAPSKSISLNHVVARRTLAPEAQSSGGGAGDEAPPPAGTGDARSSFKVSVSAWQRQRAGRGAPEAAPALSDILRNARRAKMAGAGTRAPAPKASKSMWDLSDLSQISGSGPSLGGSSAMDHLELGEDARSRLMKSQTTPAATLMRHRGAHKDDEMPSKSRDPKSFYPPRPVTFATPLLSGQVRRANLMLPHPRPWASVNKSESAKPLDQ